MSSKLPSPSTPSPPERSESDRLAQEAQQRLDALERVAVLMDSQWGIRGTRIRFGLESIISAIPGFGDVVGLALSAGLLLSMLRYGATPMLILRMAANVALDFAVGLVPILGDLFDISFKANLRNLRLLKAHYASGEKRLPGWLAIVVALLMVVGTVLLILGLLLSLIWRTI
jgi:hypothetical protein